MEQTTTPQMPSNTMAKNDWSWGAVMLDVPFLIAIKKYTWLFWYLLAFVPFVNLVFFTGFKIYMGMKGKALLKESTQFANEDERNGFIKALDHAGKILFFAGIIALGIGLILMATGALTMFTKYKSLNAPGSNMMQWPRY